LKLSKSGLIKGLIIIARLPLSELNNKGNCLNLLKGLKVLIIIELIKGTLF
jgi:hypothetical protein